MLDPRFWSNHGGFDPDVISGGNRFNRGYWMLDELYLIGDTGFGIQDWIYYEPKSPITYLESKIPNQGSSNENRSTS